MVLTLFLVKYLAFEFYSGFCDLHNDFNCLKLSIYDMNRDFIVTQKIYLDNEKNT